MKLSAACTRMALYLRMTQLLQALASQLGPMGEPSEGDIEEVLKKIPLSLGGGKQKVSPYDALPSFSIRDLAEIVSNFSKNQ